MELIWEQLRKNAKEVEGEVVDLNSLTSWLRPALHVHIGEYDNPHTPID